MGVAIVTGAGGLVGSEAVDFLVEQGLDVVGIDNDMRARFFGAEASTRWRVEELCRHPRFRHEGADIRDFNTVDRIISDVAGDLKLVVHAAAQPSHDWAARDPFTDFGVNAQGTLNLLEAVRRHAAGAAFVFLSTNKVYGDTPNRLPLVELETRWELDRAHPFFQRGIDETMSVDQSTHSLFGASKLAADVLVQEYGRSFGMNTACFRGGCLTGGNHAGTALHGFLAYLMKCTVQRRGYTIHGHAGKQVRDNIHARDLVSAIWCYARAPRPARVYNIGGGRFANCSMLEAIDLCQEIAGSRLEWTYDPRPRHGDHIWWVSDSTAFSIDYPDFKLTRDIQAILEDIHDKGRTRWLADA
ncbi:NAD-dependent epimerase/dehydratase family protein [Mesorhizobium sp. CAU 1741]|uniref:NAD-dependent epimerase/dehydratase family protein n=1 Tax=Mesorhizobium sp. CAU 1741 TaxID=3140366 RepID=UPI00325BE8D3